MNPTARTIIFAFCIIFIFSCDEDKIKPPIIKTGPATDITYNSANLTAELIAPGSEQFYTYGFVWNTSPDLHLDLETITSENGIFPAEFNQAICNLDAGKEYYFTAYIILNDEPNLANVQSFTTQLKNDLVKTNSGLIINVGTLCGWTYAWDSLQITDISTYYESLSPFENICYKKDTSTDPGEWEQLVNLLDLEEFLKININDCAVCADGCDMWIQIDSNEISHKIRFDMYRFLEDDGYQESVELQNIKPFVQKLDSTRIQIKKQLEGMKNAGG